MSVIARVAHDVCQYVLCWQA